MQQNRVSKNTYFSTLPTQDKDDKVFLRSQLLETLNMESGYEESLRKLYSMHVPSDIRLQLHAVIDDMMTIKDSIRKVQRNLVSMFQPNATYATAIRFSSYADNESLFSSHEQKSWKMSVEVGFYFTSLGSFQKQFKINFLS